jgi:hypothetical protein
MPKIAISVMSRAGSCIRLVAFGDMNSPQIPALASLCPDAQHPLHRTARSARSPLGDGGECAELEQKANAAVDSAHREKCRGGGAAVGRGQDRAVQRCPFAGSWR